MQIVFPSLRYAQILQMLMAERDNKIRVFPLYTILTMLVFLYCLDLKIRWIEKSVASIIIQSTMTNVNLH